VIPGEIWKEWREAIVSIAALMALVVSAWGALSPISPWRMRSEIIAAEERRIEADTSLARVIRTVVAAQTRQNTVTENVVLMLVGDPDERAAARMQLRRMRTVSGPLSPY
jgi:hypothetical protein